MARLQQLLGQSTEELRQAGFRIDELEVSSASSAAENMHLMGEIGRLQQRVTADEQTAEEMQKEHDAAVAEREATETELAVLQQELLRTQAELRHAQV